MNKPWHALNLDISNLSITERYVSSLGFDRRSTTPLMWVIETERHNLEMVKYLIKHGAKLEHAFRLAMKTGQYSIARYIAKQKVKNLKNK